MTQTQEQRPISVLTIAGSDSGGGAGIQADLRTFSAHGVHGLSAITAVTAQNTCAVTAVHTVPVEIIAAQVDAVFADFRIGAVKLGMLADTGVIAAVAGLLARHRPAWVVLDPVMVASSGARLLAPDALHALRTQLLPLADLLTPNAPEAELLLQRPIDGDGRASGSGMESAAHALRALGPRAVLLKGGHLPGDTVTDLLADSAGSTVFRHPRLAGEGHGTGCTLAAALAARLATGNDLRTACRAACDYVHGAFARGYRPGLGPVQVLEHRLTLS